MWIVKWEEEEEEDENKIYIYGKRGTSSSREKDFIHLSGTA